MIHELNGWDEDDFDVATPDEDLYECQCQYCHCMNKSRDMAVCNDCAGGAHQG